MTTPNIPDLPRVLELPHGGTFTINRLAQVDGEDRLHVTFSAGGTANGWIPLDEQIRELARYKSVPAEARKVFKAAMIRHQRVPKGVGSGNTCAGCNHLDGESDGANSPRHVEHQVEVGFAALAAAGLLVGPGEPAASEGEPVAWLDDEGTLWGKDGMKVQAVHVVPADPEASGFRPIYAHPPVTAEPAREHAEGAGTVLDNALGERGYILSNIDLEHLFEALAAAGYVITPAPATAPSAPTTHFTVREDGTVLQNLPIRTTAPSACGFNACPVHGEDAEPATAPSVTDASVDNSDATVSAPSVEQIAQVVKQNFPVYSAQYAWAVAEQIRALWSPAPGDASYSAEDFARMEGRVEQLEAELADAQKMRRHIAAEREQAYAERDEREGVARAEVERLRAALEAAEGRVSSLLAVDAANDDQRQAESDMAAAERAIEVALDRDDKAARAHNAARAAVEAEKCTGAGDCAVSVHVHGCYADVPPAKCDDASEHAVEADTTEGA